MSLPAVMPVNAISPWTVRDNFDLFSSPESWKKELVLTVVGKKPG